MTIGGNRGQVGDRSPAIWLHKTRGVLVSSAIDGKVAYSKTVKPRPAAGEWTKIEVSQVLVGAKHVFSITIGDKKVFSKTNSKPVELTDVKVYSGNPWSTSQSGFLQNLKIDIKTPIDCIIAGLYIMFLIMYIVQSPLSLFIVHCSFLYLLIFITVRRSRNWSGLR